ncbi:hypothetical protein SLA_1909 [Streptomyces laurentii]|uniref:Uncharacterized protein n=1 Tax=Streptomyces laurentii TaxID=39478 RepID=A0A160NVX7_STRLU|nr:hypothetical protein SLA_1909 [Streptomyces laurentii]
MSWVSAGPVEAADAGLGSGRRPYGYGYLTYRQEGSPRQLPPLYMGIAALERVLEHERTDERGPDRLPHGLGVVDGADGRAEVSNRHKEQQADAH